MEAIARLLCLLRELGPRLRADERITVLHGRDFAPPAFPASGGTRCRSPAAQTWRRAFAERRVLRPCCANSAPRCSTTASCRCRRVPVPVCLLVHDLRAIDGLTRLAALAGDARAAFGLRTGRRRRRTSIWTATRLRALGKHVRAVDVVRRRRSAAAAAARRAGDGDPGRSDVHVLHVGSVEARKNLTVVVDALALLPAAARPQLWLAGHDAGALPSLRRRAAAKAVTLRTLGRVDEPTLATLYREARAVVLPSRREGFGLPALEALAHGTPLLGARCGGAA